MEEKMDPEFAGMAKTAGDVESNVEMYQERRGDAWRNLA